MDTFFTVTLLIHSTKYCSQKPISAQLMEFSVGIVDMISH